MRITNLQITGLRAFKHAEFNFHPGLNLLIGINGVGKTTVLDSLCICLSKTMPFITSSRTHPRSFPLEDINNGSDSLMVNCSFEIDKQSYTITVKQNREKRIENPDGSFRDQTIETPDVSTYSTKLRELAPKFKQSTVQPIALYFSTARSHVSLRSVNKSQAGGGQSAAFADALVSRELYLSEIAHWMIAQESLSKENPGIINHINSLKRAARTFLPECKNLHVVHGKKPSIVIEKTGNILDVRQLSDGERSLLAIVLDIAKRLSQANPGLKNPIKDGNGIVLIDEIDLHLHPKWQRSLIKQLTTTFPNLQFIATTHSPQIIGEVEHNRIHIIDGKQIYSPSHSFGVDSSRILEEIMNTDRCSDEILSLQKQISNNISKNKYENAKSILKKLTKKFELGENDPEVVRLRTLIDFMSGE